MIPGEDIMHPFCKLVEKVWGSKLVVADFTETSVL